MSISVDVLEILTLRHHRYRANAAKAKASPLLHATPETWRWRR